MQLQADEPECFASFDRFALLRKRGPAVFKIEGVEVPEVEEADDAHPRAGDAVGVECVEGGVQGRGEFAGEVVGGVRVGGEPLEGLVPEVVGGGG